MTTPGEVSATGLGRAEGVLIVRVPPWQRGGEMRTRSERCGAQLNATAVNGCEDLTPPGRHRRANPARELLVWREQKQTTIELEVTAK